MCTTVLLIYAHLINSFEFLRGVEQRHVFIRSSIRNTFRVPSCVICNSKSCHFFIPKRCIMLVPLMLCTFHEYFLIVPRLFEEKRRDLVFASLSFPLSVLPSVRPSPKEVGILWAQLLLQSILSKLHWCFGHGLKICMWFGYNLQIIFGYFFRKLNLAIFRALSITM